MDRAEAAGFGVSVFGHVAIVAIAWFLTLGRPDPRPQPSAFEVSYVDEVGLTSAAPSPSTAPAAAAQAPEVAPPEEAAPTPEPQPAPAPPQPRPAPPRPAPSPRAAPPQPRQAVPAPTRQQSAGARQRNTGSLLGPDLLRGIGRDPASRSNNPPAQMTGQAAANIAQAITRQIQPCANRQVYPGPGAERIVTPVILRLNPDGSLAGRPRVGAQRGVDDENRRYAQRVADLAVNAFVSCAPLRGLPAELYDVPRGWSNFTMNYRLPA
ncbi:MAG TPA: cell envelope biogenesis protein TolA [Allosphingosinicella sp.]|nr:cell envelope biogenesis protein TolA [Allosphingosinicella sp.]